MSQYFPEKHPKNCGNLILQTGFYIPEISLSDRLWSGDRTYGHRNFLRMFCSLEHEPLKTAKFIVKIFFFLHRKNLVAAHSTMGECTGNLQVRAGLGWL
jgi:hypothetical protein